MSTPTKLFEPYKLGPITLPNRLVMAPLTRNRAVAVPFDRQGTGREIAYTALLLISNESSYVNARTLPLDAGHLAGIVRGSSASAE
jgi:2,4-dienoyl-CoA reductase-like NADH-dependent reductase (Old Yellow Enzyme family)